MNPRLSTARFEPILQDGYDLVIRHLRNPQATIIGLTLDSLSQEDRFYKTYLHASPYSPSFTRQTARALARKRKISGIRVLKIDLEEATIDSNMDLSIDLDMGNLLSTIPNATAIPTIRLASVTVTRENGQSRTTDFSEHLSNPRVDRLECCDWLPVEFEDATFKFISLGKTLYSSDMSRDRPTRISMLVDPISGPLSAANKERIKVAITVYVSVFVFDDNSSVAFDDLIGPLSNFVPERIFKNEEPHMLRSSRDICHTAIFRLTYGKGVSQTHYSPEERRAFKDMYNLEAEEFVGRYLNVIEGEKQLTTKVERRTIDHTTVALWSLGHAEFETDGRIPDVVNILTAYFASQPKVYWESGATDLLDFDESTKEENRVVLQTKDGVNVVAISYSGSMVYVENLIKTRPWKMDLHLEIDAIIGWNESINPSALNSNTFIPQERSMPSMSVEDRIVKATKALLETDDTVASIIEQCGMIGPDFYREFRNVHSCTPTQLRDRVRWDKRIESSRVAKDTQPFDFAVVVKQRHVGGPLVEGERTGRVESDITSDIMIPLVVNERYEHVAYVVTTSGTIPTTDPYEFIKSSYRDQFNALVVDKLTAYFFGRLDIAYMQRLDGRDNRTSFSYPKIPSGWPQ